MIKKILVLSIVQVLKTIDFAIYPLAFGLICWLGLGFEFNIGFSVAVLLIFTLKIIKGELKHDK